MRHHFVMAVVFASVFSAVAVSQRHGRADSVQNYSHGISKSADASRKQTFPQPNWDVRYKSGSFKLREGQWLKTGFVPTEIVRKSAPSATVPVDQLREAAGSKEFLAKQTDLPQNIQLVTDPDYKMTNQYGLRWDAPHETAYPSTFILDRRSKILFEKISHSHGDRTTAEEVLAQIPTMK